jgi:hypothetical protein
MKKVILLSVVILLISLAYSFAEVPCKINYQGRLIKDNVPVDGTKTMRFSIHDSAVGPTQLWTSGDVNVEVHNGLFRYVIGSDGGDLSSIDWTAGQTLYLEVKVGTDILTPREELYAYPYAITSHLLEGKTKEYFLNTSAEAQTKQGNLNIMGNVGIGTTSPGGKLEIAASSGNADIILNRIGTGSTRLFQYGTSDSFYIGKVGAGNINLYKYGGGNVPLIGLYGDVIYNAGNVGIGTTSPGINKLEVVGGPIKATGGLIIETRTTDPASPATGQMWLRTD